MVLKFTTSGEPKTQISNYYTYLAYVTTFSINISNFLTSAPDRH